MQLTTLGLQTSMPVCVLGSFSDGSVSLSSVHEPASEQSFYKNIFNFGRNICSTTWAQKDITWLFESEMTSVQAYNFTADEVITSAKQVTGLSIKDLAAVFEVSRQTLYNFRKTEDRIADRNWERLKKVHDAIQLISIILPMSPGSMCKHFVYEGHTLYSLLCEKELNTDNIIRVAEQLALQKSLVVREQQYHHTSIDQLTRHG